MKVSKVLFCKKDESCKALADCAVVLDDCLRLNNIRLYSKDNEYFLVFPSKQDVVQDVERLNPDVKLTIPVDGMLNKKGVYKEFFHPVDSFLYYHILETIVEGYKYKVETGNVVYIP